MKKLNIKRILEQLGGTESEFAYAIGIQLAELHMFINGDAQPNSDLLVRMESETGLRIEQLYGDDKPALGVDTLQDTWKPSKIAKNNLIEYIEQGLNDIQNDTFREELSKLKICLQSLKKPKIAFAGQSDAGKSTLINALLCAEKMPAKWTPTTSIAVYVKHIQDRPSFMDNDVWIFGKKDGQYWDDRFLSVQEYCEKYVLAKGDFSLLETYGTHTGDDENQEAASAVVFIDSALLLDCDLLDLPGFGATKEDDALHKFNTQENITDILIYLSRSNGFLQDGDLEYLHFCLNALSPVERNGKNNLDKLGNLFIIASQANSVGNGNFSNLNDILAVRCHALCKSIQTSSENGHTLIPYRSDITGYSYSEQDFLKRFYTYEKQSPRLCRKFINDFKILAEELPKALRDEFCSHLKNAIEDSTGILKGKITEYQNMMDKTQEYIALARNIKEKEPARKTQQSENSEKMRTHIETLRAETMQDIQAMYSKQICEKSLRELIEKHDYHNRKVDRESFSALVNNILLQNIQEILKEKADYYSDLLKEYISDYNTTFSQYKSSDGVSVEFDMKNSFTLGLAGLSALGASGIWLATSLTAWTVGLLGTLAGWGPILAVGGVIGIAIGGVIASALSLVNIFNWDKNWATSMIKSYEKEAYLTKVSKEVETYWSDTQESFSIASERVEADWKNKIKEYESLGNEENLIGLREKLYIAQKGLDFFIQIPMPGNG